tara:strand:+ start:440 stop:1144 length:705 start_codon:yes stop_codon:yes gene_type:complete
VTSKTQQDGFSPEQNDLLKAKLQSSHVSQRQGGGGMQLDYIEGWHAIDEANRIFGFDKWSSETIYLQPDSAPVQANGKWQIRYISTVRITIHFSTHTIIRDGSGFGDGRMTNLNGAVEMACKEAETDALKRALRTFGNQFGNALYDKKKSNVTKGEAKQISTPVAVNKAIELDYDEWFVTFKRDLASCPDESARTALVTSAGEVQSNLSDEIKSEVRALLKARKAELITPSPAK